MNLFFNMKMFCIEYQMQITFYVCVVNEAIICIYHILRSKRMEARMYEYILEAIHDPKRYEKTEFQ